MKLVYEINTSVFLILEQHPMVKLKNAA